MSFFKLSTRYQEMHVTYNGFTLRIQNTFLMATPGFYPEITLYKHKVTPATTGKKNGFLSPTNSVLTVAARLHSKDQFFLPSSPSFVLTHKHREQSCPGHKRSAWYHPILCFPRQWGICWISALLLWDTLLWVWQRGLCLPEGLICPNGACLALQRLSISENTLQSISRTYRPVLAEGLQLSHRVTSCGGVWGGRGRAGPVIRQPTHFPGGSTYLLGLFFFFLVWPAHKTSRLVHWVFSKMTLSNSEINTMFNAMLLQLWYRKCYLVYM